MEYSQFPIMIEHTRIKRMPMKGLRMGAFFNINETQESGPNSQNDVKNNTLNKVGGYGDSMALKICKLLIKEPISIHCSYDCLANYFVDRNLFQLRVLYSYCD